MLLRLLVATLLIAPTPLADQPMRVAIHVDATGMTIARILPEPFCASASNALTEALENEGLESYGVTARTAREAAAAVHRFYATGNGPDPSEYPPAGDC
ncbi:hypothetical protein [Kitasatospora sp. NPDC088548]|uniref:hypothetical protein n=1 Tax=Kitasatospora sp. NPDC088548 TaxID=3364075 RepID=UPI0038088537